MARYDRQRSAVNNNGIVTLALLVCLMGANQLFGQIEARKLGDDLTACQHLRRSETRRAKAFANAAPDKRVRVPRCNRLGEFEPVQCQNESAGENCWCVDEYGVEIPDTRNETRQNVVCSEPDRCSATSCRMFCASGFARDARSGCSVCKCRDPCEGIECPNGQSCQQQEVKCKTEPCPPIPSCKKGRSLANVCPAGLPLSIDDTVRPFLCGIEPGKPQCPPLYQCLVEPGNDYGVCCPSSLKFQKPGVCPNPETALYTERTGYMCGTPCSQDLECKHMEKCCFTKGCLYNCQQPFNVTTCHQARALSDILAVSEREGRGYVPNCNGPGGMFSPKQCSRNGLVCWCVDPRTGHKIKESMGAADMVSCDGWENMIARSVGRSMNTEQCDTNICAAVCEYGFKNDHNGCPTCECSEPCEGFKCPMGSHCEVATDPLCQSGSALCSSLPICKPDLVYSNPCDIGTPLSDNITGEVFYCIAEERQSRAFQPLSFFDEDPKQARSMSNRIFCPENHKCMKLHGEAGSVCCPLAEESASVEYSQERQQSMCEYLRDFSDRMEGTEEGMQLAIPPPRCAQDGAYEARQCSFKKIKVTRKEQRQILEENTIRKMKMLLHTRSKRQTDSLKLYRVDDGTLNIRVAAPVMGRSAKVISSMGSSKHQGLSGLFETEVKKVAAAPKRPMGDDEIVEMEVEECWCVDGFGTEIPESRGFNVTVDSCLQLRESIECLDLTCRMGCEYGFILSAETKCPACQCRDPCEGISCSDGKECRTVEVSCEEEYCPPVPACLPRKAGQCPFLVPPSPDNANTCDYECRTDSHCEGIKRCCSNGCGTQCVEPQMKTACQHLQTIQMHQASELGIPAKQMYIAQCDAVSGKWNQNQCGPDNVCWCVDEQGVELSGTRIKGKTPICKKNSAVECPLRKCKPCENGFKVDPNGCQTCECRNFCDDISCSRDEECNLINVECIDLPCPKMPICVPKRESVCPEGIPLKQGEQEVGCGPQNENEACPTTHTCQLNPVTNRGVCCAKTRDVCFESVDQSCLANVNSYNNATKWRFNPKANKCTPIVISESDTPCQNKNLFHSELACNSVCPVLTQCERVKLKNSLVARRADQTSVWFQPRCDPVTGHWSPIQCLGKQPSSLDSKESSENQLQRLSRAFSVPADSISNAQYGVCWCSDKKGAPLKGTLTRNLEPICNHRQARRRMHADEGPNDPLMEELIKQMTMMVDIEDNDLESTESTEVPDNGIAITERVYELANSIISSQLSIESTKNLMKTTTRCVALKMTASFAVDCDENGAFVPTQCNDEQCWCVDAAGNQVPSSDTFPKGTKECKPTSIDVVTVELHLQNEEGRSLANIYDIIRLELHQLIGDSLENLRVHDNMDGSVIVRFELHRDDKIDKAFAIEENIRNGNLILGYGNLKPDITMSRFVHQQQKLLDNSIDDNEQTKTKQQLPIALATSASNANTLHTVVFILTTSSAFLVSIFVVYVMLKRGKRKTVGNGYPENRVLGTNGDKYVDFSSPIFVLSAHDIDPAKLEQEIEHDENIKK